MKRAVSFCWCSAAPQPDAHFVYAAVVPWLDDARPM